MPRFLMLFAFSALALAACGGDSASTTGSVATATAESGSSSESLPAPEGSLAGEPMVLGNPDADVVLIEYASVTCPACAAFHAQVMPTLKEKYIDEGKIRFEYREFPTAPADLAQFGFSLARCAATDRGAPAYFAVLDMLYARQREWAYGEDRITVLENIAKQAGVEDQFLDCPFREDIAGAIEDNIITAKTEDNVTATPTLILNGEKVSWNSVESLTGQIDAALAATN